MFGCRLRSNRDTHIRAALSPGLRTWLGQSASPRPVYRYQPVLSPVAQREGGEYEDAAKGTHSQER